MKKLLLFCCWITLMGFLNAEQKEVLNSRDYDQRAQQFFEQQKYQEALVEFEKALLESEDRERIHYNIGLCHQMLKQESLAQEAYKKALSGPDSPTKLKAVYNLGHLYYTMAIESTTNPSKIDMNKDYLNSSLKHLRDVKNMSSRSPYSRYSISEDLKNKSRDTEESIFKRYKLLESILEAQKGKKIGYLKGTLKVSGRGVLGASIYSQLKWEDGLHAQTRSGDEGIWKLDGDHVEFGRYNITGTLYPDASIEELKWQESNIRVPMREKENIELQINGPLSLACPYIVNHLPLDFPYNDSSRASGPQSILNSTDWGELTDGRPAQFLPDDHDRHPAYVSFKESNIQLQIGLPQAQPQTQNPQNIESSTSPAAQYKISLKGYHDGKDAHHPEIFQVLGIKDPKEPPTLLYTTNVSIAEKGKFDWISDAFDQQDCRQLVLAFSRQQGQRISLHEISIMDQNNQGQSPQQNQQDQNNQNQDQQQNQDQNEQNQNSPQNQPNDPLRQTAPLKDMVDKIRKRKEDEKPTHQGIIQKVDKDW